MSTKQSEERTKFNQDFASRYHQRSIALTYLEERGSEFSTADYPKAQTFDSKVLNMTDSLKSACKASNVTQKQGLAWLKRASTSFSNVRPLVRRSKTTFAVGDEESSNEESSDESSNHEDDEADEDDEGEDLPDSDGAGDAAEVPPVDSSDEDGWGHVDRENLPKPPTDYPLSIAPSASS